MDKKKIKPLAVLLALIQVVLLVCFGGVLFKNLNCAWELTEDSFAVLNKNPSDGGRLSVGVNYYEKEFDFLLSREEKTNLNLLTSEGRRINGLFAKEYGFEPGAQISYTLLDAGGKNLHYRLSAGETVFWEVWLSFDNGVRYLVTDESGVQIL